MPNNNANEKARKRRAALVVAVLVVAGCATSPLGRSQLILFPEGQMTEMGLAAYQQLKQELPIENDPAVNGYVSCVATAVTSALPGGRAGDWEVTVFAEDSANAFALPGGKIGVHTGLLDVAENQHQLATVIGHEIAHVQSRHGNERVSTNFAAQTGLQVAAIAAGGSSREQRQLFGLLGVGTQVGVLLPFSRRQEQEADLLGLDLMASAGFDPRESVQLWRNMAENSGARPPEFLSTHPSGESRIRDLGARMERAMAQYQRAQGTGRRPDCGGF